MFKKVYFSILCIIYSIYFSATETKDLGQELGGFISTKPGKILGGGTSSTIWSRISGSTIVEEIQSLGWLFAIIFFITTAGTLIFSHNENMIKTILKIMVTLVGVSAIIYWGTSAK